MTNKSKIQILEKVIKQFENILKDIDVNSKCYRNYDGYGICDTIYFMCREQDKQFAKTLVKDDQIKWYLVGKEFLVTFPHNQRCFKWGLDKRGYQARIRACKNAIKRLEK